MKVRTLVMGFIAIVSMIAVCRALGGEALLDMITNPQAPNVDLDPR